MGKITLKFFFSILIFLFTNSFPENIYSGEPDSLDGTSSEIMPHDDPDDDDDDLGSRRHLSDGSSRGIHSNHMSSNNRSGFGGTSGGGGFQLQIHGRSPLDALAMLHLERCAHRETRKELNQLRKKYELLRDEFDSGEGLSQSTSLLFSRLNGDVSYTLLRLGSYSNDVVQSYSNLKRKSKLFFYRVDNQW